MAFALYFEWSDLVAIYRATISRRHAKDRAPAQPFPKLPSSAISPWIGGPIALLSVYLIIRYLATAPHLPGMFWFFPGFGYLFFAAGSLCCLIILTSFAIGLLRRRR